MRIKWLEREELLNHHIHLFGIVVPCRPLLCVTQNKEGTEMNLREANFIVLPCSSPTGLFNNKLTLNYDQIREL